jgi:hypothetical protein
LKERPGQSSYSVREGRLPNITRALALAIQIESEVTAGKVRDYADAARVRCLSRERVSQVVRLRFLAPDIQVEILYLPPSATGRYPISEAALRSIANRLSWAEQRRQWLLLKQQHGLSDPD